MKEYTEEQMKRIREFATMSDWDFYEKYLADAPLEEQAAFMNEFPDFLECREVIEGIDTDEMLRKIMERVKE